MTHPARLLALLVLFLCTPVLAHPGASASIDHYSHEIERNPRDQAPYIRRGIAYSNDGQYDKALADFEQAKTLDEPVVVSFDLGVLHYRRGEYETARAYFDEYLEAFPDHAACLEYRARLARDMGDTEAAVADFQRVFGLQQRPNPGHYISVAEMLESSGPAGIDRALQVLDGGNEKLGLTPQLQQHAIQLELRRGRTDLAIARLQTLEPMLGESPDWKVQMAELQLQAGDKDAANKLLEAADQQLATLRKTPARITLQARIDELNQQI
jgi:Tfp pilus assembly protein PilF